MANQSLDAEENEFLQSVGLRSTALEHLVADAKPLTTDMQARIRQRVAARIDPNSTADEAPTAPRIRRRAAARTHQGGRRLWLWASTLLAAAACAALVLVPGLLTKDAAMAMEKAVARLNSYHGVVDLQWYTLPDRKLIEPEQAGREIWVDGRKYAWTTHRQDSRGAYMGDFWVISDGNHSWWFDTFQKQASVGLQLDSAQAEENLGVRDLAHWALRNPHTVIGTERVAGRLATKLEIKTPDGLVHYVWVDQETDLPLRVERYHGQRSVEVITYRSLEVNPSVDQNLFVYRVPADYKVTQQPGQWVTTVEEAAKVAGFTPVIPQQAPKRMAASEQSVQLVYDGMVVSEANASSFNTRFAQQIGRAAGGPLVVVREGERLEWVQGGIHFALEGNYPDQVLSMARTLAPDLKLPDPKEDLVGQAAVKIDLNTPAFDAQADEATRLGGPGMEYQDPVNAAYTFFKQQLGGDWWHGDKNPFDDAGKWVTIVANTGVQAILDVKEGPYKRLYVQRLRPNSTVWMVAGYDLR